MSPITPDATVLITGASAGIGREMALLLGPRARRLLLLARRTERLESLKEALLATTPGLQVRVLQVDLSDAAAVERLEQALASETIDVLINNAGVGHMEFFETTTPSTLHKMVELNITSLVRLTRALSPGMVARGRGGILNISSAFAFSFLPQFAVYAATKHFVSAFSEGLRLDLSGTGVTVTQACPGPVASEFGAVAGTEHLTIQRFIRISSEQCARDILRGFERGRALVIPGHLAPIVMAIVRLIPAAWHRPVLGFVARVTRRRAPRLPASS